MNITHNEEKASKIDKEGYTYMELSIFDYVEYEIDKAGDTRV